MTAAEQDFEFLTAHAFAGQDVLGEDRVLLPYWSIAKTAIACAVVILSERGAFALDDMYEDWPFTIRQLLGHSSGLNTYGGPLYHQAVAAGEEAWGVEDMLARHDVRRLRYEPGQGWLYSNIGYLFLRRLIERCTGRDLGASLQELVFGPAGIRCVRLCQSHADLQATHWGNARNYDPNWVYHGLLVGTPADAVRLLAALLDGQLVSDRGLQAMVQARPLGGALPGRPWTETGYGLGLMIGRMDGVGRAIGHSGGGPGSVSALYAFPDLPGRPIVSAFTQAQNEGLTEAEAARIALAVAQNSD